MIRKIFESPCKQAFVLPSGTYQVEYSIPAASHFGVYESVVFLTRQQAQDAHEAVQATKSGERVFNSDYSDWKHRNFARQFSEILDTQHPGYRHPVGVLFSIKLVKEQG